MRPNAKFATIRAASARNEAECINLTLGSGGKVWVRQDRGSDAASPVYEARAENGKLMLRLTETDEWVDIQPFSVLPSNRGVWTQIELVE